MLLYLFVFCLAATEGAVALRDVEQIPASQLNSFADRVLSEAKGKLVTSTEIPLIRWKLEKRPFNASMTSQEAFIRGPFTLQRDGDIRGTLYPSGTIEIVLEINLGLIEAEYPKVTATLWKWQWSGALTAVIRDPTVMVDISKTKNVFSHCQVDVDLYDASGEVSLKSSGLLPKWLLFLARLLPDSILSRTVFRNFLFPILEADLQSNIQQAAADILCNNSTEPSSTPHPLF